MLVEAGDEDYSQDSQELYKGKIIGQGYNQCNTLNDATAHAEMLAITAASNTLGDWRLNDCTMYVLSLIHI